MKNSLFTAALFLLLPCASAFGEVKVVTDQNDNDSAVASFSFKRVRPPSKIDSATSAKFRLLDGDQDNNGGSLVKLHDGTVPSEADEPAENFFFAAGTSGGRILIDLGSPIRIQQINTYSWHPSDRGPQVYTLYAAEDSERFNPEPAKGVNPEQCGWKLVARVDTRPSEGESGGQYGVNISDSSGSLGNYRYLLFDVRRTEERDPFGNTFYSEIDVWDLNATNATSISEAPQATPSAFTINSADKSCAISINTADAPELREWAEQKLAPVLAEWYPKLAAMLSSEGFTSPKRFTVVIRPGRGVAATSGTRIEANSTWLKGELEGEAIGALLHEEVHVLQQYGRRRNSPEATRPPGWLVEGIPDYLRWFKYEPQSHGADLVWLRSRRNQALSHDAGYRISANFLNYVAGRYDPGQNLIARLNAACRAGKYRDELWKACTGKTLPELAEEWKGATKKLLEPESR